MVDRHRSSLSHIDQNSCSRWENLATQQTLLDILDRDGSCTQTSLTLAPINSSYIYARRHSAHICQPSEASKQPCQIAPPVPLRPPPVPKRTLTPANRGTLQNGNAVKRAKSAQPPPLPPTPKTRAPPFNQLLCDQNKLKNDISKLGSLEQYGKFDINRNAPQKPLNNFTFDEVENQKYPKPAPVLPPSRIQKPNLNQVASKSPQANHRASVRQDSGISSDSFSQNSSPSYTTKTMETPLLPPKTPVHKNQNGNIITNKIKDDEESGDGNVITKSASTPASFQAIIKFGNGSNMSLRHRILRDVRRPSENYKRAGFLWKFRFIQIVANAIALFAIAVGTAAYFKAYPSTVIVVNKTTSVTLPPIIIEKKSDNPAPGVCLPVIVRFCKQHHVPYNYTVYPNYVGHFGQRDAQMDLEVYDAIVDVRCYELAALFLCSIFVPKCGPDGHLVRPCRNICLETKRRCGFFLEVFGLALPKYLECKLFPESPDPNKCIGYAEVKAAKLRASNPICPTGFQCDLRRCIPMDWQCDGHVDCKDQSDELNCQKCDPGMIHCGREKCITQEHMCDGKVDCPWGQDERNCLRLSERNGDEGRGQLEVFRPDQEQWVPACVAHWDDRSAKTICSLLGYSHANYSRLLKGTSKSSPEINEEILMWRLKQHKRPHNLIREFASCNGTNYPTVDLSCGDYICGKVRKSYAERRSSPRIVGGIRSKPGDWPFLAALLGGPEEVFYCAGVLIADQWVLTASHCVGNHSEVSGWTIQLGITRRHAHSFYGQKMKVKRVVPHPYYNLGIAHDNDIALFQLASRVTFHEHLLPVCLPKATKELPAGTVCTVIGWGKKEDTGMSEYEPEINEVQVPVLNRDLCNTWLETRDLNVTDGMICAGYKEGGKDACQGDSGGPLLCREKDDPERWFVGGIVSWGIKCAHPHLPGVYAYVPKYIDWIQSQISRYSEE